MSCSPNKQKMAKEQKPENAKIKKPKTTPATETEKSNGKRKIDVTEQVPIIPASISNSLNHHTNGTKSKLNSKSTEEPKPLEISREDNSVAAVVTADGDVSKKKKKVKFEDEEKESSLLYQIPMSRVSRIIKSEDPNLRITQEAIFIINKASEKFLQVFATEAYANAFLDRKKHIDYKNLSSVVSKRRRFDFLSDFVPEKVKAEDALKEVSAVEI